MVIDHDEERLEKISQLGEVPVLKGDGGDEEVLAAAQIQKARGLASVLPEDKDNLLTTVTARLLAARFGGCVDSVWDSSAGFWGCWGRTERANPLSCASSRRSRELRRAE